MRKQATTRKHDRNKTMDMEVLCRAPREHVVHKEIQDHKGHGATLVLMDNMESRDHLDLLGKL